MAISTTYVTTFIDWDSARRIVRPKIQRRTSASLARDAITPLQDAIAKTLTEFNSHNRYRVTLRFYHGWYTGKTKTQDRINFEKDIIYLKTNIARTIKNVNFSPDIEYSDYLLSDYDQKNRLYDTLRRREDSRKDEQKLIDTALTCDVLHFARFEKSDPIIIIGDDDDLLPSVFTTINWGSQAFILRVGRASDNRNFDTNNIIKRI